MTICTELPVRALASVSLPGARRHWQLDDIDLANADPLQRPDDTIFYILAGASFLESGSALYTRNLLGYYAQDQSVSDWLRAVWEPEELLHGAALRTYLGALWPGFDWNTAYGAFLSEYSAAASPDAFEATPRLELAARCMIETGTATLYRMLQDCVREPVLWQLLGRLQEDEMRHYKNFLYFFRLRQAREGGSRLSVIRAIVRRVRESRADDAWIGYRHAFESVNPGLTCRTGDFDHWQGQVAALMRRHFPFRLAAQMLLAPLALPAPVRPLARRAAQMQLRRVLLAGNA